MIKTVLITVVVLLALSGLCELLHLIRMLLCMPRGKSGVLTLIVLKSGIAAEQLNFASAQRLWLGDMYSSHIIAVDTYLDDTERENCRKTAGNDITFCDIETAAHIAESISGIF